MHKIYYSPEGYWKGLTAIQKLSDKAGVSYVVAKNWLKKQPIWQIYLPAPKKIVRPHFINHTPNDTHQMDLLFLPYDKVGKKRYKYALTVIDLASRYKDAEPLSEKSANAVTDALIKIYRRGPLRFPKFVQVDSGTEFKGPVTQLFVKHGIHVRRGLPGLHRSQAVVENFNRQLSERLFSYQYHQEFYSERNTEWVKRLPAVIKAMNSEVGAHGLTPVKAIKMTRVTADPVVKGAKEKVLDINTKVRYLYQPGEVERDVKRRATDPIWSLGVHSIKRIVESKPVLYYLRDPAPPRSFVRSELQIIPDDTEF